MDNNFGENKLTNVTISNASMDNVSMENVTVAGSMVVSASTMINGSVYVNDCDILSISKDSVVTIDGNNYSGQELGRLFKMLSKFIEIHPEYGI